MRKLALTAHIISSVGWLGAIAGFLALALAGLTSEDPELVWVSNDAGDRMDRARAVGARLSGHGASPVFDHEVGSVPPLLGRRQAAHSGPCHRSPAHVHGDTRVPRGSWPRPRLRPVATSAACGTPLRSSTRGRHSSCWSSRRCSRSTTPGYDQVRVAQAPRPGYGAAGLDPRLDVSIAFG